MINFFFFFIEINSLFVFPKELGESMGFLGGLVVKNPPANKRDSGLLGREDPLEKEMATHSSSCWEISWTEKPGGLYSPWGCKRVGYNLVTKQQEGKRIADV